MDFNNIFGKNFGKGNNFILILLLLLLVIPALGGSSSNPSGGNLVYFNPGVAGASTGSDGCNQFGFFNKYSSQSGLGGNVLFIILILALLLLLGSQNTRDED
ncbi:hypothetical protein SAMN05443428_11049 [Caloramator quimbayensis]|uniref:Uncharacterized protein n=1 Tax=Caloramator quimbayensis TaxID=1147123 RepID=A0A1T4XLZ1_9CLOT|nr:hypothetical protein [Caloramator quimbayensis]SKA90188.1 hypothetical protein SAMN05443428_11049 [Caloramator quimbayensis]